MTTLESIIANLPNIDDSTKYYYLTKAELDYWIKAKIFSEETSFGDMRFGLILKEVKRL